MAVAGTSAAMNEEDPGRLADQREHEADELARRSDKLKDEVSDVRQDWQQKRASEGVPGAVPEAAEESHDAEASDRTRHQTRGATNKKHRVEPRAARPIPAAHAGSRRHAARVPARVRHLRSDRGRRVHRHHADHCPRGAALPDAARPSAPPAGTRTTGSRAATRCCWRWCACSCCSSPSRPSTALTRWPTSKSRRSRLRSPPPSGSGASTTPPTASPCAAARWGASRSSFPPASRSASISSRLTSFTRSGFPSSTTSTI